MDKLLNKLWPSNILVNCNCQTFKNGVVCVPNGSLLARASVNSESMSLHRQCGFCKNCILGFESGSVGLPKNSLSGYTLNKDYMVSSHKGICLLCWFMPISFLRKCSGMLSHSMIRTIDIRFYTLNLYLYQTQVSSFSVINQNLIQLYVIFHSCDMPLRFHSDMM